MTSSQLKLILANLILTIPRTLRTKTTLSRMSCSVPINSAMTMIQFLTKRLVEAKITTLRIKTCYELEMEMTCLQQQIW